MTEGTGILVGERADNILPPAPRVVRYRSWGAMGGLWALRLFLLPHTIIGLTLLWKVVLSSLLALAGSDSQGQIVRAWIDKTSKGKTIYHIAYTDGTLANRERTATVPQDTYSTLLPAQINAGTNRPAISVRVFQIGSIDTAVPITNPNHPSTFEFKWVFIALFWNGIMSVFLYLMYWFPYRNRQAYRYGVETVGQVARKWITTGKGASNNMECVFCSSDGKERKTIERVSKRIYDQTSIGQPMHILYLPNAPKWAAVYELGFYDVIGPSGEPIRMDPPKQITPQP